jgi:nicotinate-nucleotide pyrophosphorylase (carboxylating)
LTDAIRPVPPPQDAVDAAVRRALAEDFGGAGDITSLATIPADTLAEAAIVSRGAGVIAGLAIARAAFAAVDPLVSFEARAEDGDAVPNSTVLAVVKGPARAILGGERVALNFLGHLSGSGAAWNRIRWMPTCSRLPEPASRISTIRKRRRP